jgi:hypothetical protein
VCDALWLPGAAGEREISARAQAALEALRGIEPRNEREGMLAVQMVVTHSAAMDCFRRAAAPEEGPESREMDLRTAQKMMSLYLRQLEAFDKCRERSKPAQPLVYQTFRESLESVTAEFDELLKEFLEPRCDEASAAP